LQRRLNVGVKVVVEVGARNAEPQRRGSDGDRGSIIWDGDIDARSVLQIITGDDIEHESGGHCRASDRAYMVERPGQRDDARSAHTSVSRFKTHDAAVG